MLVSYNWLKDYLGAKAPAADAVADLLTFHAFEIDGVEEVEGDTVIDVDVLPNRSSDCLCHRGIAREIATLTGNPLEYDPLATPPAELPALPATEKIAVAIEDTDACPRFTASLITGIEVKESPEWLQKRLRALGQRPINNIVDATNYVMYAIGQPLHAYDADTFPQMDDQWKFNVRYAREGEVISLLAEGGKEEDRDVTLKGTELLIVDGSSDTPIGLAGVKGGRFAGISENTTNIIVEAAHFNPTLTRKTARGLGIVIDASKRFENEPSRELPSYAQKEIITLITDIAGGASEGVLDVYLEKTEPIEVVVRAEKVNALLGIDLDVSDMVAIVTLLGARVRDSVEIDGGFAAVSPFERTDLTIEESYIEEIGRIHGYQHVASVVPETVALSELNPRHFYGEKIRQVLLELGFSEVITTSFRKKDKVQLQNALASDKSYLRSTLSKNIETTLDQNIQHTDLLVMPDVRVFEIGTVFYKDPSGEQGVVEHVSLALGARVKASGYSGKEDPVVTEAIAAVETALSVSIEWQQEKGIAECDLSALLAALPAPEVYDVFKKGSDAQYQPFSVYPAMSRDVALWTDGGEAPAAVAAVLRTAATAATPTSTPDLLQHITLFDEFTKDSRTSYAFRLVFQSHEKTLTDTEINKIMDAVYVAAKEHNWEVR